MVTLYGISNCDTVRKARKWLDRHELDYRFHDFRKDGITTDMISAWLQRVASEQLVNKRSTTWRALSEADRARIERQPTGLLVQHPTLIKRPVLELPDRQIEIGFNATRYAEILEIA